MCRHLRCGSRKSGRVRLCLLQLKTRVAAWAGEHAWRTVRPVSSRGRGARACEVAIVGLGPVGADARGAARRAGRRRHRHRPRGRAARRIPGRSRPTTRCCARCCGCPGLTEPRALFDAEPAGRGARAARGAADDGRVRRQPARGAGAVVLPPALAGTRTARRAGSRRPACGNGSARPSRASRCRRRGAADARRRRRSIAAQWVVGCDGAAEPGAPRAGDRLLGPHVRRALGRRRHRQPRSRWRHLPYFTLRARSAPARP